MYGPERGDPIRYEFRLYRLERRWYTLWLVRHKRLERVAYTYDEAMLEARRIVKRDGRFYMEMSWDTDTSDAGDW